MAQIFPKWGNRFPLYLIAVLAAGALLTPLGAWYYFSPEFTDVGYQPVQPVPFSHELHVGELEMDCRYCHATVERSPVASVPPTQSCMNCHQLIARESEKLREIRESLASGRRVRWIRVHKLPEYAYFDHSLHLRAGVGCSSCHGDVSEMERIHLVEPLSMSWCLECHRNPQKYLRNPDQITDTDWSPEEQNGTPILRSSVDPPTDCSACHR